MAGELEDLVRLAQAFGDLRPPVEDRFGASVGELVNSLTEKERQTLLLCAVFLNAKYDRHQRSRMLSGADILRKGLDAGLGFNEAWSGISATMREDRAFIIEDLQADEIRGNVFSQLTDEEMRRFCETFDKSLGIVEVSLARERVFIYDYRPD